jgi:flap endonuclease-1
MGIRGLSGFLKWKASGSRNALNWSNHRGERWAIDSSCLLYRARAAGLSPLTVVAALIVQMRKAGITPIFIFDGKPPAIKADVLDQRREQRQTAQKELDQLEHELSETDITQMRKAFLEKRVSELKSQVPHVSIGDKDKIKQLLYGAGVLFVSASGEADDMLGYLARTKEVAAIVSTDMDMLARGVQTLVVPETQDATMLSEISTAKILVALQLTYAQFVDACVLMGTDYTNRSFKTVPPAVAIDLAKRGVQMPGECAAAVAALRGENVSWTSFLSDIQLERWNAGPPPCEPDTIRSMCQEQGWPITWADYLII